MGIFVHNIDLCDTMCYFKQVLLLLNCTFVNVGNVTIIKLLNLNLLLFIFQAVVKISINLKGIDKFLQFIRSMPIPFLQKIISNPGIPIL